jgi:hypothetical protein
MQFFLPLFPVNLCGRSSAQCALTLHSSELVCAVCGCVAPFPADWLTISSS